MKRGSMRLRMLVVTVLMSCLCFGTAHAQSYPDLTSWLNQWFKISYSVTRLHFADIGVPPYSGQDVGKATGYLVCTSLTAAPSPVLSCYIYIPNDMGAWVPYDFDFNYVAGSASDFACSSVRSDAFSTNAFTVEIKGTEKTPGNFTGATVKTLGGYSWEIDDVPGSTERWVGSLKFNGAWFNTATQCKSSKNSTLPPCVR